MKKIVEDLLGRAVTDAPDETGHLKATGRTSVETRGNTVYGYVTFSTPYAAAQEEGHALMHRTREIDLAGHVTTYTKVYEWVVRKHPGGGKTHYLGDNLKLMVPAYREKMRKALDEAVRG